MELSVRNGGRFAAGLLAVLTTAIACSNESAPTGQENVQVQVSSYFFLQEWGSSVLPSALLTGPNNSAAFTFTNSNDISGLKDDWHKYKFELQPGDVVTLRLNAGTDVIFERSCTVHPRALDLTYLELVSYGPATAGVFEEDGPLPPGPNVHCACGTEEYGDDRNANQCSP